jgi:hypothetical protein
MNHIDPTLNLAFEHQVAMRRQARIHSLIRAARHRRHGFAADDAAGAVGIDADPVGLRQFLDQ